MGMLFPGLGWICGPALEPQSTACSWSHLGPHGPSWPPQCAAACSGALAALLSLLAPLPYACDWRPYLTIHDPAFAPLAGGALPSPKNGLPCLLGVTNL